MRTAWEIYLIVIDAKMQNKQKFLFSYAQSWKKWSFWCYFWCSVYDAIFVRFYSWLLICILNITFFEIFVFSHWMGAVLDLLCIPFLPRRPPSGLTCFKGTLNAVNKTGTTAGCTAMNILEHLSTNQSQEFKNPIV